MKKYIFSFWLLVFSMSSFAQSAEEEYIINQGNTFEPATPIKLQRWSSNFNLGTAFTAWKGGSMFSTYANPNLNYRFTSRFSLTAGFILSNNQLLSQSYDTEGNKSNSSFINSYVYLSGAYQVNEKLQIVGSVLYRNNVFSGQMNPNAFDNLDYSVGAKYKVTKNIEVGVQFTKRNYSPFVPYFENVKEEN